MLLTSIIAKGLALIDAIISYFVTITGSTVTNVCNFYWVSYNVELTACGQRETLVDLMIDLLQLRVLPQILEGLFAV